MWTSPALELRHNRHDVHGHVCDPLEVVGVRFGDGDHGVNGLEHALLEARRGPPLSAGDPLAQSGAVLSQLSEKIAFDVVLFEHDARTGSLHSDIRQVARHAEVIHVDEVGGRGSQLLSQGRAQGR